LGLVFRALRAIFIKHEIFSECPIAGARAFSSAAEVRKGKQNEACLREIGVEFEKIGAAAPRYKNSSLLGKAAALLWLPGSLAAREETE